MPIDKPDQGLANEHEWLTILTVAVGSIGAILAAGTALISRVWTDLVTWATEQRVLVSAADHPWIEVPHTGGAGIDAQRTCIVAAFLVVLAAAAVDAVRRQRTRKELR